MSAGTVLQSISILFDAAALGIGMLAPPDRDTIQTTTNAEASGVFDLLTIDATLEEVHSYTQEVTEHPVERGADITDHVRPKPVELRLRGIVSDTPIDGSYVHAALNAAPGLGISAAAGLAGASLSLLHNASISKQTFEMLRRMASGGGMLTIHTPYLDYTSMVITSAEITRDQHSGAALVFALSLRQITTVESATVDVTLPAMAQAPLNMGQQQTSPASAAVSKKSILRATLGGANVDAWANKLANLGAGP